MRDSFSTYHPLVNFTYFVAVIFFGMFFLHPAFLLLSFLGAVTYSVYLNRGKAVRFDFLYMLPVMVLLTLFNAFFNHMGSTILVYIDGNSVTLESIYFGIAAALMFITVLIWFSCYNAVMTSDKFIYLFGRVIPAISLIFSMVLRFVPKFKAQIKEIAAAQRAIGKGVHGGSVIKKARHGLKILSIFITWALENAIETADSMKARGYGLHGRTSFSNFRFDRRDKGALAVLVALILLVLAGAAMGETAMQYFPMLKAKPVTPLSLLVYAGYLLLLLMPTLLDLWEDLKWKRLQSKI